MALFDFIQRLLGLQKPSATMAKERLQLVLAHDRSDLNPELLEQMRREILEVVQKYVEIDLEGGDVSLATEDRVTALVANLPIRRAKVRTAASAPAPPVEMSSTHPSPLKEDQEGGGPPDPERKDASIEAVPEESRSEEALSEAAPPEAEPSELPLASEDPPDGPAESHLTSDT